ncbi:hypothetical protein OIY81_523 [Cryptosporidium canis]|uniref:LisH domain-containing protein n=1 Tax=Cryptosporidium canis TaxID=195482 RepID=A0ABQ8P706_9CRYT|nr:hypothetical protein OJ252_1800 [Cryptosporidium canis]KAJ1614415.1 hypothetical protein OIY81_523 [Cryptosporidium canis]
MNQSDQEYVERRISGFLSEEHLIRNIKNHLRIYISKALRRKNNIRNNLLEDDDIVVILRLIHEFLNFYEINGTCKMLEEECGDILQLSMKGSDRVIDELEILRNSLECNTVIECLLQSRLLFREKREIDEVTNTAIVEASKCIESLQDEIKTMHNVYFEQVNAARELMEMKVSNIEKLYLESVSELRSVDT